MNTLKKYAPTPPAQRITQLDILRGFALMGILLVNIFGYNASLFHFSEFYQSFSDPFNTKIFNLVINYAADKFIFIFSFLFGVSFGILHRKFENDHKAFLKIYFRRMVGLMIFGAIHILFFWAGDILLMYALLGFLLVFSVKIPSGKLLLLSVIIYYLPVIYLFFQAKFPLLPNALSSTADISIPQIKSVYALGSWADIFKLRLYEYFSFRYINGIYYAPKILALFLLGYWFYKQNMLKRILENRKTSLLLAVFFMMAGIILNRFTADVVNILSPAGSVYSTGWYMAVYETVNIFLGSAYILLILTLSEIKFFRKISEPLKYAGRAALSNYLFQSVIVTTIMYGYGLGKFGSLKPWQLVIFALFLFSVQVFISKLWLKKFTFGPLEWLWRKFTYLNV